MVHQSPRGETPSPRGCALTAPMHACRHELSVLWPADHREPHCCALRERAARKVAVGIGGKAALGTREGPGAGLQRCFQRAGEKGGDPAGLGGD